ncbi:uncharacterized protein LTR77_004811 [Saxophila tyrrhenica]|uniref:Uncharacterized protein n=1 Tax=Saxophila tyrrhenica TaxID=1690608 RepID=A0AAV9PDC0_9PEZI|nr:hypothetical protein LTR77_004811 [Saxophila tyrrhenica]
MDWTGGTRKRFAAGRNNATIQKQKAHFAKARAALHATPNSQRSFRPIFEREITLSTGLKAVEHSPTLRSLNNTPELREHGKHRDTRGHGSAHTPSTAQHHNSGHAARSEGFRRPAGRPIRSLAAVRSRTSSRLAPDVAARRDQAPGAIRTEGRTDEETLLLVRRRQLLRRPDWLGLSMKRHADVSYASSIDNEHVGKRRKVKRSALRNAITATNSQDLLLPQREVVREDMMSGALPSGHIEVKIGTDAFATHTQPSCRSQTPGHTSMRQPSTDVALLSEESMLLEDDGGMWEGLTVLTSVPFNNTSPEVQTMVAETSPMSEMLEYLQHVPQDAIMQGTLGPARMYENEDDKERELGVTVPGSAFSVIPESTDENVVVPTFGRRSAGETFEPSRASIRASEAGTEFVDDRVQPVEQDEEKWRRLAGIKCHAGSSHTSMAAVGSSSQHLTASDHSAKERVVLEPVRDDAPQPSWSTPRGAGTQASILHQRQAVVDSWAGSPSHAPPGSPSASLQQIMQLAEQPVIRSKPQEEVRDDDALWKSFIIGSQSSSVESSPRVVPNAMQVYREGSMELCGPPSPSAAISGFGTSDHSTTGDTGGLDVASTTAPATKTSSPARQNRRRRRSRLSAVLDDLSMTRDLSFENDDIEDNHHELAEPLRPGNIHAGAANVLNPKRFRKPQRPPPSVPVRPAIRRTKRNATRSDVTRASSTLLSAIAVAAPSDPPKPSKPSTETPAKPDFPVTAWLHENDDCSKQIAYVHPLLHAPAVCMPIPGTNSFSAGTNGPNCTLTYYGTGFCFNELGSVEVGPNTPDCHAVPYSLSYTLKCG